MWFVRDYTAGAGVCKVKDALREVFNIQLRDGSDIELENAQAILSREYDEFYKRYGYINDSANGRAFDSDPDYYLLTSSYGKSNSKNSTLYVTTLSEDGSELVQRGSYKLPSGAEQVTVTSDNNIAVTYEGDVSRGYITVLDGEKLIDV